MRAHVRNDGTGSDGARATSEVSCWRAYRRSWPWSVPEGHPEVAQKRAPLLVVGGGGAEGDVHPLRLVELLEVDLREDDLLPNAERVVFTPVEGLGRYALEVAHAGEREVHEAVVELVHLIAAKGDHRPDLLSGAQLEDGDRLL